MRIYIDNATDKFKKLGLHETTSHTKFIPDVYKYNISEIRKNILAGLLDTDGHVNGDGNIMYTSVSKQLIEDVAFIARSLGHHVKVTKLRKNKYKGYYQLTIITDEALFKLERKNNKITSRNQSSKKYNRIKQSTIIDIQYSHKEESKCITVDNESNCYLIGDLVVTHNSKGTRATQDVNRYARRLQRDWMLSEASDSTEEAPKMNLQEIRSIPYMEEAVGWNSDGNFDRISAMGMVMILWEEIRKYSEMAKEDRPMKSFATSEFFTKNYGPASIRSKRQLLELAIKTPQKSSNDLDILSDELN
jgi:hypothetical protein